MVTISHDNILWLVYYKLVYLQWQSPDTISNVSFVMPFTCLVHVYDPSRPQPLQFELNFRLAVSTKLVDPSLERYGQIWPRVTDSGSLRPAAGNKTARFPRFFSDDGRKTGRKWPGKDPHDASPKPPRRPDVAGMMPPCWLNDAVILPPWCQHDASWQ